MKMMSSGKRMSVACDQLAIPSSITLSYSSASSPKV